MTLFRNAGIVYLNDGGKEALDKGKKKLED